MNITVAQSNLSKALTGSARIATNKANLPVLNNVLLRTQKNRLVISSTNLELASTTSIPAKVVTEGSVTVPAKLISEFVSNLPSGDILIESKSNSITIKSGGYSSSINGIDAEEFPELPEIDEKKSIHYTISVGDFKQAISQTIFACSSDVTRPVLTGVFWHSYNGWLYLVGTDSYRLAEKKLIETKSDLAAIIPTSTLHEVLRSISDSTEEIDILFDEAQVRFRINETEITSRLIDGKYPDYRKLIPVTETPLAIVAVDDIVRTAKIASLFARESGGSINMSTNKESQSLSIESVASDVGKNNSEIGGKITDDGTISLNSRYLTEVLSVIDSEEMSVNFTSKLAPIIIQPLTKSLNYTHVIMPLKS